MILQLFNIICKTSSLILTINDTWLYGYIITCLQFSDWWAFTIPWISFFNNKTLYTSSFIVAWRFLDFSIVQNILQKGRVEWWSDTHCELIRRGWVFLYISCTRLCIPIVYKHSYLTEFVFTLSFFIKCWMWNSMLLIWIFQITIEIKHLYLLVALLTHESFRNMFKIFKCRVLKMYLLLLIRNLEAMF